MLLQEIKHIALQSTTKQLREFGITMGVVIGLVSAYLYWSGNAAWQTVAAVAGVFAAVGLVLPVVLKPLYSLWMSFAVVMGFVMTRVILTLLFSIVFVPVGLMIRLLRKDPLNERIEPSAKTYWHKRDPSEFDPRSAAKQY
ncbi:MAG TPA: hypothetical protein ENJ29_03690 [Bacteroidetes bacterium]|nr:hypothetical protein [Bacteroidota bacterium]